MNLFNETITRNRDWEDAAKSGAFIPLIKHIYEVNQITFGEVRLISENNEVFQVGNTAIKLFRPAEAKLPGYERIYETELSAMNFCKSAGVLTPDIICTGIIKDDVYSFPYTVMVYIDGVLASEIISGYDKKSKIEFSMKLKEITDKIYIATDIDIPRYVDYDKMGSTMWAFRMPEAFVEDRKQYLSKIKYPEPVFQHGDLRDGNIFVDKQGRLVLIDFAESLIAPSYYDIAPLILNGGWYDSIRLEAYFGEYKNDIFYDNFTTAWLLNWFGAEYIILRAKETGIDIKSITSVNVLRNMVVALFENL
jgi:serine/threonine protein kinase